MDYNRRDVYICQRAFARSSFFVERRIVLTSLTRQQIGWGLILAGGLSNMYIMFKLNQRYNDALEVLAMELDKNAYLLELFNKYNVPVDEFEQIALKFHHITTEVTRKEEED